MAMQCISKFRIVLAIIGIALIGFGVVSIVQASQQPVQSTLIAGGIEVVYEDGSTELIGGEILPVGQVKAYKLSGEAIVSLNVLVCEWSWVISPTSWTPSVQISTKHSANFASYKYPTQIASKSNYRTESIITATAQNGYTSNAMKQFSIPSNDLLTCAGMYTLSSGQYSMILSTTSSWSCSDPTGKGHSGNGLVSQQFNYEIKEDVIYSISGSLKVELVQVTPVGSSYSFAGIGSIEQYQNGLLYIFIGAVIIVLGFIPQIAKTVCKVQ